MIIDSTLPFLSGHRLLQLAEFQKNMQNATFYAESLPFEQIEKLTVGCGYSSIYAISKPSVDVVGNWQTRCCSLADTFQPILDRIYNFEVREDDIFIVTSPKCGTTWAQEMTWLILNDFDFEKAKSEDLPLRSPFLEFNGFVPNMSYDSIEVANNLPSPRLIKSHLPSWLLPKQVWTKKRKIIYIFRNPKDAAISYFHHWRGMVGDKITKQDFMRSYIDGYAVFNPFWPHVLDFWQMRNQPEIFFTSYERMKRDLAGVIKDVCKFLGREVKDEQLSQLVAHLSFDKMKDNPACNHSKEFEDFKAAAGREVDEFKFVRRGIVGSHKDEMPQSVIQEFDDWTEDNLKDYQLTIDDFTNYSKY